jgi:thioredoxin 1
MSVRELSDATFEREVLRSEQPVVVDFWAPWCAPCRAITPILEALAEELDGRVVFAKINVDEHPRAATRYGVLALPTVIVFSDRAAVTTIVGARPRAYYENALLKVIPAS